MTVSDDLATLRRTPSSESPTAGGKDSGGDPVVVHPADSLAESQSELNGPSGSPTSPPGRESRRNRVSDLPDGLHGYTPEEAFEVRVKHATAKLCDFDPDAAAYYQRTEAWVRLVLAGDDQREAEWNPQYEARQRALDTLRDALDDALAVFVDTQWDRAYRNDAPRSLDVLAREPGRGRRMTGDPLDRIETWARALAVATIPHSRDVLALVEVARAARWFATEGNRTLANDPAWQRLRAALARLDGGPE